MQKQNMSDFPKKYSPNEFEKSIYTSWEKKSLFKPQESRTGKSYYIPMPPPNVTSVLHVGHSVMLTLEDIMTRYHRMKGDATLLLPGTDHAGISTQVKVEEKLAKAGVDKSTLSRDEFLQECWKWNEEFGGKIQDQFRRMGTSCDWSKEKFTLDSDMNERVIDAFNILYEKGLIYQGEYMVNYDPVLKTVVSDQEVIHKEEKGKLYHITYFVSGSDNEVVVATTRPETLLGDVAVAVHPKDKRYKKLLKAEKKLILPIVNIEIPLIADESVDMEFGTGAVKITPAHDASDFEMGKRHELPLDRVVIEKDGRMSQIAGIFAGQDYKTARNNIVELLRTKGNLLKIEDHSAKVWYGERTGAKIETIISKQWFVKIQPLAEKVIAGYEKKQFQILPERYNKVFEDWIYNLRDWCISRQLQWGHQIPVWYTQEWNIIVAKNYDWALEKAKKEYGEDVTLTQDEDVLDTWFSSALWPFATLGFNMYGKDQPELFEQFYPAQVLETGHDIIFFWVVRMLLFGYEFTGETPFKTIYLHGLVKDKIGRKMSKSLWNGVDPIDMIETHGTDALRMTLAIGNTPGNDLKFDEENVENNSIFLNKLWNACRFVSVNTDVQNFSFEETASHLLQHYDDLALHEKWILSKLTWLTKLVTESMENYSFSEAGLELYTFTKNRFCDYYIEEFKLSKESSKYGEEVILYSIHVLLRLWHPYIPFVSEELYQKLWFSGDLMIQSWPTTPMKVDKAAEKAHSLFVELVREVRRIRAENNIMPNKTIWLQIYAKSTNAELLKAMLPLIAGIVKADSIAIIDKKVSDPNLVYSVIKSWVEVYVDTANAIDVESEKTRLKEQILDTKEYIAILDKKLLNDSFVRNAPKDLVHAEMAKKEQAKQKLAKLQEKFNTLS
jgi:valyl-tRNA synthetase